MFGFLNDLRVWIGVLFTSKGTEKIRETRTQFRLLSRDLKLLLRGDTLHAGDRNRLPALILRVVRYDVVTEMLNTPMLSPRFSADLSILVRLLGAERVGHPEILPCVRLNVLVHCRHMLEDYLKRHSIERNALEELIQLYSEGSDFEIGPAYIQDPNHPVPKLFFTVAVQAVLSGNPRDNVQFDLFSEALWHLTGRSYGELLAAAHPS